MRNLLATGIALLALAGCNSAGTAPNQALIRDTNLTVAALQVLSADAVTLGAPVGDVNLINAAISAVQAGEAELQKNATTPQDLVTLVTNEINAVAPPIERDLGANATIKTGVMLLGNFVTIMAADVAAQPTAAATGSVDHRARLQMWVAIQQRK